MAEKKMEKKKKKKKKYIKKACSDQFCYELEDLLPEGNRKGQINETLEYFLSEIERFRNRVIKDFCGARRRAFEKHDCVEATAELYLDSPYGAVEERIYLTIIGYRDMTPEEKEKAKERERKKKETEKMKQQKRREMELKKLEAMAEKLGKKVT